MSHHRPSYYPPASSARPAFNAPQSFPSNAPQSFPSNAPQAFSPWPPSDASMMNRPNVYGGRGGHGGPSLSKGGRGGLGGATLVATEDAHRYREIHGDFGGDGGWGGVQGGAGGMGQATTISKQLVSDAKAYNVPNMTVADFCDQYNVSRKIRKLLEDKGFETAGELFEVADTTLRNAGFKSGQIEEIRRALKEYYHAATTSGRASRMVPKDIQRFDGLSAGSGGDSGWGSIGTVAVASADFTPVKPAAWPTATQSGRSIESGDRGVDQIPTFTNRLITSVEAYHGPALSIRDFEVSDKIRKLLEDQGFETVGALFEVSDADFREVGLNDAQIVLLKKVLRDLVSKSQT